MISSTERRRGFTLVELLVVIAMIAMVAGAVSTGFSAAQERARVQKASAEVKAIAQAIMAYENYAAAKGETLPERSDEVEKPDRQYLGFLLDGQTAAGEQLPALLMASLTTDGVMLDPWGVPYKVKIKSGSGNVQLKSISSNLKTGYFFPNLYRLSKEERQ